MTLLYHLCRGMASFSLNVFGRLEVTGQESVPPSGPLIVVANHVSHNDAAALVASLPRTLNFLGKRELFKTPIHRLTMKQLGVYPVTSFGTSLQGMRAALELLSQGHALAIFPEGRISPALTQGRPGAAYLAIKSQAPVVPVGIGGTEKFPPWRMPFPLRRVQVHIGRPVIFPAQEEKPDREAVASVQNAIMRRIAALLPEEYQGVYAAPQPGP